MVQVVARSSHGAGRARQPVVAGITVELQDPVEAAQELLRVLSTPARGVEEDNPRRVGAAPWSFIARQGPE